MEQQMLKMVLSLFICLCNHSLKYGNIISETNRNLKNDLSRALGDITKVSNRLRLFKFIYYDY